MSPRGEDGQYDGIIVFRDVKGMPAREHRTDMKSWWPQNEAVVATLMAYQMTADAKDTRWRQLARKGAHQRFLETAYGEWFGYLHRDGQVRASPKGKLWKRSFYLPRTQLICWELLEGIKHLVSN
jgi:N-acylglucosamine 2-epimerase